MFLSLRTQALPLNDVLLRSQNLMGKIADMKAHTFWGAEVLLLQSKEKEEGLQQSL